MNTVFFLIAALTVGPIQEPAQEPVPGSMAQQELVTSSAQADLIADVLVPVREAGIVSQLLVKEGDWVKAGQTIAEFDRKLNELEVQAAKMKLQISELKATDDVDMRYSKKSQEVANATLARSQSAVDTFPNSISKTEIEQLRLEVERATLSIEKAQFEQRLVEAEADLNAAEAEASELRLQLRTVSSPIDGMVVEVIPQQGEWLNSGQTVARIVQLNRMRIKAQLPGSQIDQSYLGRRAVFESAINRRRYEGTIHFVSPEIFQGNEKVQFWFDVDNPDNALRRREPGSVRILPAEAATTRQPASN